MNLFIDSWKCTSTANLRVQKNVQAQQILFSQFFCISPTTLPFLFCHSPPLYLVLPTPPLHYLSPNPPYYLTLTFFLCLFLLVLMRIWTPNLWICSPLHYPLDHTSNLWNSPYNSQPYNLLVPDSPWPKIIIYSHMRMTDQHVQVNFGWFSTRKT